MWLMFSATRCIECSKAAWSMHVKVALLIKKKKIPESCPLKVADDGRVGKALLEIYHLSAVLG